jgi:hypothetical protein
LAALSLREFIWIKETFMMPVPTCTCSELD